MSRAATAPEKSVHRSPLAKTDIRLTRGQVAQKLGVSVNTVKRAEEQGHLEPFSDAHGVTRYKQADVLRFAARRERKSDPGAVAAYAFQLFREGRALDEIVIETRKTPEVIAELHRQWLRFKDADVNAPLER